jgi:DNA-binding NtrC family response regulator
MMMKTHKGPQILLIDDDTATVMALSEALRDRFRDLVLSTASSAEMAMPLLSSESWDVIICDVLMPGLSGLAVLREAGRVASSTPVILVTAGAFDKEEAALYGGAYAFIEKPVDVDHLISVIKAAFERKRLDREVSERNRRSMLNLRMKSVLETFTGTRPDRH